MLQEVFRHMDEEVDNRLSQARYKKEKKQWTKDVAGSSC